MGSSPIGRAADVAQLVEHAIGNGEVSGSIPDVGSLFVFNRFALEQNGSPFTNSLELFSDGCGGIYICSLAIAKLLTLNGF